jgi:hypothetical protein
VFEQDYVLRLVKQLAAVVARMIGLREKKREAEVIAEAESAAGDLLGLPPGAFDRLDGATLAQLLKEPEIIRTMAELLDEEAAAHHALGRDDLAARRRRLAAELRATRG